MTELGRYSFVYLCFAVFGLLFSPKAACFMAPVPKTMNTKRSFVNARRTNFHCKGSAKEGIPLQRPLEESYVAAANVTLQFPSFLELMNLPKGECATSEPFFVSRDGPKFCVKLYPRGGGHGAQKQQAKIPIFNQNKAEERIGMYLQYLGNGDGTNAVVDATYALRLKGRQRVGRKFDVEWRAGMRFVPLGETNLSNGMANDFGAHLMQTPLLKDFLGVSDDQIDDPTPVTAEVEVILHDTSKEKTAIIANELLNDGDENSKGISFFSAWSEDIRKPTEPKTGFEHDPERVRVGSIVVPIFRSLVQRSRMFEIGVYPGVEYRILRILKDGKERFTSCPGAEYDLKPIYPLVAQLERPWPVTVKEQEIPKLFTPSMYNAVSALGSLLTAVFGLTTAFVVSQAVSLFFIPSRSMDPTLQVGDVLLVDKVTPRLFHKSQKVGDVVLFSPPSALRDIVAANGGKLTSRDLFVKRIAAEPGSRVAVDAAGKVSVNGQPSMGRRDLCEAEKLRLIEKYIKTKESTLDKDEFFVMGDCSSVSIDSRVWGPLQANDIVGKPILRLWPLERFGPLRTLPLSTTEESWTD